MAFTTEIRWNRNVKALATLVAGAPHTCFSIVHIRLGQFFVAFWTREPSFYLKVLFSVDISAWNMFD